MEWTSKETLSLLYFLLPGFLAAWVFFGLTAHPKKDAFERVIQALIFTVIVRALTIGARKMWWVWWHPRHPSRWTDGKEIVASVMLAGAIGVVFSICANYNIIHWILRKVGVTKRTSYPSEWYSGLNRFRRDLVLTLKDGSRLRGWAEEWPDQCDRGHFLIEKIEWLDETGKCYPQTEVKRTMIPAEDVRMIQFMCNPDELAKEPNEQAKRVEQILADRANLAALHQTKEPDDGRREGTAKPSTNGGDCCAEVRQRSDADNVTEATKC